MTNEIKVKEPNKNKITPTLKSIQIISIEIDVICESAKSIIKYLDIISDSITSMIKHTDKLLKLSTKEVTNEK